MTGSRHAAKRRLAGVLLVGTLVLAACGGDDDSSTDEPTADDASDDSSTDEPSDDDASADSSDDSSTDEPSDDDSSDGAVHDAAIVWALPSDPGSLDPQQSFVNVNVQLAPFAYDPLVHRNDAGEVVSGLAESWEDNGLDGLTFTLRQGVTCSDGSELTATDVARNFEYAGDPENGSNYLGAAVPTSPTVTADDAARTVSVVPSEPFPFFLLALTDFPIVCAAGLDDREALAETTIGTGPYELTDVSPGEKLTYTRRDGYSWGPDGMTTDEPGLPQRIEFRLVDNETTLANQLISGEVNVGEVVGPDRERLESEGVFSDTYPLGVAQMFFNQSAGRPGADEYIRRAVTMGTDLDALATVVTGGFGAVSDGLTYGNPRICPADTVTDYLPAYDPAGARALLEENGWTEGSGGIYERDGVPLTIELSHLTDVPGFGNGAELMATQLREVGIDLTLNAGTTETLGPVIFGSGDWDISWLPTSRVFPQNVTPLFQGPGPAEGGLNFSFVANSDYEALVEAAAAKLDESGCPEWEAAEVALIERVDVVPFAASDSPIFGSADIEFEVGGAGIVRPMSVRVVGR